MAKVLIMDTILRDAHQSQAATRMRLDDMLPACEILDKIGYYALECWGVHYLDLILYCLGDPAIKTVSAAACWARISRAMSTRACGLARR